MTCSLPGLFFLGFFFVFVCEGICLVLVLVWFLVWFSLGFFKFFFPLPLKRLVVNSIKYECLSHKEFWIFASNMRQGLQDAFLGKK